MAVRPRSGKHDAASVAAGWPEGTREQALEQLGRILASPHFRTTKRCSLFLQFVVDHASNNDFDCLRERGLGVAVFERDPSYDTNEDPVVRIAAGEVRKRLAQYYLEEGHELEPRITLPAGSYVPEFHPAPHRAEELAVATLPHEPAPAVDSTLLKPAEPTLRRWTPRHKWMAAAAVAAAAVAVAVFLPTPPSALDQFWAPVVAPDGPVLVCLGQPKGYFFNTAVQAELDRWFEHRSEVGVPPLALKSVPVEDIVPAWDRMFSVHDVDAFARVSAMFARMGRSTSLKGGRLVSLADLRGRPLVLIGGFSNDWTLSLTGESRFFFDRDRERGGMVVRDRRNPSKVDWKIHNSWPQQKIPLDYAIVSRVINPVTEQTVVIAAGITHFGTQAAGEFLTNPTYFADAVREAPADWSRKNLQVVLSTQVMSGTAGPPKVLAINVW